MSVIVMINSSLNPFQIKRGCQIVRTPLLIDRRNFEIGRTVLF